MTRRWARRVLAAGLVAGAVALLAAVPAWARDADEAYTTHAVSLQDRPSNKANAIDIIPPRTRVQVAERGKYWARVMYLRRSGYVPLTLLSAMPPGWPATAGGLSLPGTAAALARPIRVIVQDVYGPGLSAAHQELISAAVLAEVRKLVRVSAVSMAELRAMMTVEEQRQLMGCTGEACFAEIAGALGSDVMVMGTAGVVGTSSVLSLKRIDLRRAVTTHNADRTMTGGAGEEFLLAVGAGVEALFPEYPVRPGLERGVAPQMVGRWHPPPLKPWMTYAAGGGSAGLLAISGILFGAQQGAEQRHAELRAKSQTVVVPAQDLIDAENSARRLRVSGIVMLSLGGAAAIGTGVMALFTDWAPEVVVTPTVTAAGDGAGIALAGRF